MKAAVPAIAFLLRHFLFVAFVILLGCTLWTIAYVLMLVLAAILGGGLGGPLAYPAGIIMVLLGSIALGWGVFAPASAIGSACCGFFKLPKIAAIPVVFVSAFPLSYLIYFGFIELATSHSMPSVGIVLMNYLLFLSIPLGIYWWLTEGPGALFDTFRRWLRSWFSSKRLKFGEG